MIGACAGGNKRDFYGSDLWVLKYLPHFKWHHLTEKIGASSPSCVPAPAAHRGLLRVSEQARLGTCLSTL